jgi:hypothetical protein
MFPVIVAVGMFPATELPVRFESIKGGYQVTMTRAAAEKFRDALDVIRDEKSLAEALREAAKSPAAKDAGTSPALEVVALVLSTQVPQFKKSLAENLGANGVVVRVYGLQRDKLFRKPRPILQRAVEVAREVLPDDAKGQLDAVLTAAKTTPLVWKVEPRK